MIWDLSTNYGEDNMLNPGTIGAKRQSWAKHNPRDALRDAILANPKASEAHIAEVVWETVRNERGYWRSIFDYWFANNYRHFYVDELAEHSVTVSERRTVRANGNRKQEIATRKEELRTILMDHALSSGKLLRNATFRECAQESGWLREVSKQGKPNAIVGKHLTEKDLLNLRMRAVGN